jgi:probable HAF family extracellular repeat protein
MGCEEESTAPRRQPRPRATLSASVSSDIEPMVELRSLGGDESFAADVNEHGDAVGSSDTQNNVARRATFWPADGGAPRDLGTLGGTNSWAGAINDRGDIVGASETANGATRATLWPAGGGPPRDLGTLGGRDSWAYDINEHGDIIGLSHAANNEPRPTLWPASGGPARELATPSGARATPVAINNLGDVVGRYQTSGQPHPGRPVLWRADGGAPVDLGTLGGPTGEAWGINDLGDIVGTTKAASGRERATLWPRGGEPPRDLGGLSAYGSAASAINNRGDVVGESVWADTMSWPTVWPGDGGPARRLDILSGSWALPSAVTSSGYIAGHGEGNNGMAGIRWFDAAMRDAPTGDPRTTVRIYKDYDAWRATPDGGRDEATLTKMGLVKGKDFAVHPMSSLGSGIPAGTRVVIITANSAGAPGTSAAQRRADAQQALAAFLEGGGTLLVDLADNEEAEGYRVPGAAGTPAFTVPTNCPDVSLAPAVLGADGAAGTPDDHPFVRGPDGLAGSADDLDDEKVDLALGGNTHFDRTGPWNVPKGCSAVHGNLKEGITIPREATILATAAWPAAQQPVLAEYCHVGGRVIVNTFTLGYFGHKPREGTLEPTRSTYIQRSLFAYALSPEARCELTSHDHEAPVVTVPQDRVVNATVPSGAIVNFVARATDNVGVVSFSCTRGRYNGTAIGDPPHFPTKTNTIFPVGHHTVSCTASDAAGYSTSQSFGVRVLGAAEQLRELWAEVVKATAPPYEQQLYDILSRASNGHWASSGIWAPNACLRLDEFVASLTANTGTLVTASRATPMIASARRIKDLVPCDLPVGGMSVQVMNAAEAWWTIRGATVTLTGGPYPGFIARDTTNQDGYAHFWNLGPGTYTVTATSEFVAPGQQTVVVEAKTAPDVRLVLEPSQVFARPLGVRNGGREVKAANGLSMQAGASIQLEAVPSTPVMWSTDDPTGNKATVTATGLVTMTQGNDKKSANEVVVTAASASLAPGAIRINSFAFDHFPRTLTLVWRTVPGAVGYQPIVEYCQGTYEIPGSDGAGLLPDECTSWARSIEWDGTRVCPCATTRFTFDFRQRWYESYPPRAGRWRVEAVDASGTVISKSEYVYFNFVR